jgi:hypothetical protein
MAHLDDVFSLNGNDTSHDIMVTAEVLGSRVVNDIGAQVQRSLEVRRHHGVVNDDKSFLWGS